jgi:1-deoxy-D-xylulose-5-phosphate synthase
LSILDKVDSPRDLDALSYPEVAQLATECRETIIETITKRGGHLASNLGAVELTLALHRVFHSPKDRLVWDTSNQCYTHKLVTGRRRQFASIRTAGGLSGFAEPHESEHDMLAAGHAGTGLSYALGMSLALQNDPEQPYVLAVVGDGALTSGPSYEALNNIGHCKSKRLIVIFNDNGWSISENVGWPTRPRSGRVWEELGLHYIGTVDGHDQASLEEALRAARDASAERPVVLHVLTHKGRGYKLAEDNPSKFHQPGTPSASAGNGSPHYTYSQVFAKTLIELMAKDEKIVAISAAMLEGTALTEVRRRFPDRVFDVGIAEEHAVIMAAGMAKAGWRPVVSIYSTFLQRSFDQLIHDVALQSLPVTICIDRAGLVGDDGKTHQGVFDIAYTRVVPNMVVAAPKDENELQHLLFTAIYSGRPFAVRYPRGFGAGVPLDPALRAIPVGTGEMLRTGSDVTLFAYGSMVPPALEAATALATHGIDCGVINARFAKPLDIELLEGALELAPRLVTLEEHLVSGGLGSAVFEAFEARRLDPSPIRVHAIPDVFIEHAPQAQQRSKFHLDAVGIAEKVLALYPELEQATPLLRQRRREMEKETVTW